MPVAAPSASEELEALELARSRLEAALSSDENWRALTRSRADGDHAADSTARRARNTRLEMALADNALYQAWKHTNGAIEALRTRSAAQSQAAEPLVRPAPAGKAARGPADLPDDVAALLRSEAPRDTQHDGILRARAAPEPVAPADSSPSARTGLVDRLERLEGPSMTEAPPTARAGGEGSPRGQGRARSPERQIPPVPTDPPEAMVTFVVREQRAPLLASAELSPDLGTERNSALFERLRGLGEAPEPADQTYSPSDAADEEAEVTIISAERLRQRRETEERAGIVRRFRKALSGD
jgi:hypothetical protein